MAAGVAEAVAGAGASSQKSSRWSTIIGANVLWLGFSMLFDGLNALVLPERVASLVGDGAATAVGLYSLLGIAIGMLIQPLVGSLSDRLVGVWGRFVPLGFLIVLLLASLTFFALANVLVLVIAAYVVVQVAANAGQAVHQAVMPDVVAVSRFGRAAGVKGALDLLGAVLGFALLGWLLEDHGTSAAMAAIAVVFVLGYMVALMLVGRTGFGRRPLTRPEPSLAERTTSRTLLRIILSRFLFLAGTYGIGRFFLFFVAHRLELPVARATEEAGALLGGLALLTAIAALPAGWATDRFGRRRLMFTGAALSAAGALLLIAADGLATIFLFGAVMSLGSAAFSAANWASAADLAPAGGSGRVLGLANIGTGGAAAAAGLFGPLVDAGNSGGSGTGYVVLLAGATACFVLSVFPLVRLNQHSTHPVQRFGSFAPTRQRSTTERTRT